MQCISKDKKSDFPHSNQNRRAGVYPSHLAGRVETLLLHSEPQETPFAVSGNYRQFHREYSECRKIQKHHLELLRRTELALRWECDCSYASHVLCLRTHQRHLCLAGL